MKVRRWYSAGLLSILLMLFGLTIPAAAGAAGPGDSVVVTTPYPWVVAEKGKTITFSLDITNKGETYQDLDLQIADGPVDWKPILKNGGYTVKKVTVAPGKSQLVDFQAEPPVDAKAADYKFSVKALGPNGALLSDLKLQVSLADKVGSGLKMNTQYPELRGQAGTTFSFKMDVKNDANIDRPVSFSANAPENWEVTFKASYDSKQINTMQVKAGDSQAMDVDIKPPDKVEAGDYTVKVQSNAGSERAELTFKLTILGNYKLSLSTTSGQLNAKASVDQPASVALRVRNTGASTLQNVTLSASKPDGWDVTFNPEKIEAIAPDQFKEVTASIKPGGRALAGDYMVSITSSGGQTSDNRDIRVTVETPTTWGWAGIAVIVLVLGGLGLMFGRLSRR